MKKITLSVLGLLMTATTALADCGLRDERGVRIAYSSNGPDAQTFANGCDVARFQDLSEVRVRQLLNSNNCSIESYNGGGESSEEVEVEVSVESPNPGHSRGRGRKGPSTPTTVTETRTITTRIPGNGGEGLISGAFNGCEGYVQVFASE